MVVDRKTKSMVAAVVAEAEDEYWGDGLAKAAEFLTFRYREFINRNGAISANLLDDILHDRDVSEGDVGNLLLILDHF